MRAHAGRQLLCQPEIQQHQLHGRQGPAAAVAAAAAAVAGISVGALRLHGWGSACQSSEVAENAGEAGSAKICKQNRREASRARAAGTTAHPVGLMRAAVAVVLAAAAPDQDVSRMQVSVHKIVGQEHFEVGICGG